MPAQLKKLNTYNKPFWTFILSPKRLAFLAICAIIFTGFLALRLQTKVFATAGINRTINFQGKVVNRDGTNVADGQYTFVFKLWDASSGGSNPWTETQNNVQVTAGIFRVSLGSVTTFASAGVDFNTDNLYLGINFNSDGEMTPRVRFAAVPYAINAETVAGLTVTNTSGTLTIPNSKTVQFGGAFTTSAQDLTLTLTGGTNVTLPTSGTLATLGGTENLSNKTFTSTVTISGVTTDITTGTNEALTITPNGTGNVLINPSAGGQAALIVDKNGLGDVFSASVSGTTKFAVTTGGSLQLAAGAGIDAYSSGALSLGNGSNTSSLTLGRASAGITLPGFDCSGSGNGGKLTTTSGGVLTCSADGGGTGGGNWTINSAQGTIYPINSTLDMLVGGSATQSAVFSVLGVASGTNPTASISAVSGSNNGNGIVIAGNGTIQSLRNNTLTLGGNTSGELVLKSRNVTVFQNPGTGNILIGENAGSLSNTSSSNTFVGFEAGLNNSNNSNTFIGYTAGRTNGSGSTNTFVGQSAGYANNGGSANAFFGFEAGRYTNAGNNTFIGQRAGYTNNGGTNNVFLGFEAGESPVGANANVSGQNNVFIGYQSGPASTTQLTNAGAIGYQALVNASNALVLGGTGANALNVGIGTTTPLSVLQVVGGNMGGNAAFILNQTGVSTNDLFAASSSGTTKFVIKNDGTASTSGNLVINAAGSLQTTNNQTLTIGGSTTGLVNVNNNTGSAYAFFDTVNSRLGLGTTPTVRLEVSGSVLSSGTSVSYGFRDFHSQNSTGAEYGFVANTDHSGNTTPSFISFASAPTVSGGTVTDLYHFYAVNTTGAGSVTNQYGLNVAGMTKGTNNAGVLIGETTGTNHSNLVIGGTTIPSGVFSIYNSSASNNYFAGMVGLGISSPVAPLHVSAGNGANAAFILNQTNSGDIFAASSSGTTKFIVKNDGTASSSAGFTVDGVGNIQSTLNQSLTLGGGTTGELTIGRTSQKVWLPGFDCSGNGNGGKLTTTAGGVLTCASDTSGLSSADNFWQYSAANGVVANGNLTTDLLIGGTSTQSAMFSVLGIAAGTNPSASVSAQSGANANKGIYMSGDGSLQAVRNNILTLGGSTTGDISLSPLNGLGNVRISSVLTQGARSVPAFSISQANDASNNSNTYLVDVTNSDSGSTTALVNLSQVASGVSLQISGTIGNTGRGIFFPSGVSGNGAFGMLIDNTVTNNGLGVGITQITSGGTGFYIEDIDNITSGKGINLTGIAVDPTAFSGDMIVVNPQRFLSTGSVTDTGNYLDISRSYTANGGSWTIGSAADLVTLSSNCTVSSGSCVDASSILSLAQSYGVATGAVLDITNTGLGSMINVNGASGGKAAVIINQTSTIQDIFAASASGSTKFVIKNDGTASTSAGFTIDAAGSLQTTRNQSLTLGGGTTGELTIGKASQKVWLPGFDCSGSGNGGKLTTTTGGVLTCAADGGSAGAAGTWTLDAANGIHTPINNTADLLLGGTSTQSAMFSVLGLAAGTNPSASVSAINGANANKGIYLSGDGSLQSVRNNFLTLGGNTTGDIYLKPLNGAGMVRIIHGTTGTGGLMLGDSETDATQKAARLKSIPYNSASSLPISMLIAINSSTNNVLNIGGGSSSEYAVTDVYIKTATTQTTTVGTTRFYVGGASGFVGIGDTNTSPVARLDILDNATDINGEKLVLRRTGAGDVGLSFQQNGISAFGIVNRSGSGNGLAFVDNYYEGSNGTEIARFYASSGVGIGTLGNTPVATLDVRGVFANSGTQPVASFSGTTSFAGLIVDNSGVGDLFTASTSGLTRFALQSNGVASASGGFTINNAGNLQSTKGQTLTIGGNSTGDIAFKPGNSSTSLYLASTGAVGFNGSYGSAQNCLVSNGSGSAPTWGNCATGAGQWWNLNSSQGTTYSINTTLDTLFGGNSTASAGFRVAGATKNYGTVAAASVSANTSFAGLVVDNRGTGELLTASSSGLTRFTIYNSGNVVIGNGGDSGFRLDVKGSVRIGNNTTTDDIVKDSSVDFTQSGYAITTNDSVNTVSTSENQIKLVTDLIGAGASLTAPAADQTTGTNVTTGSVAFQRPDKKFVVFVGAAATSKIYDTTTSTWTAGPSSAGAVSLGAGARAFQRQNGSFLVLHGGAATSTTVYSSGGSANLGTAVAGPATTAAVGAGSQIIRRPDGKILVIHGNTSTTSSVHDPVTATGTTSLIGTFITGPATTGNVVAGSFVFQRPDGKWILGLGGSTTTNLYDPSSSGVGGGGAFSAGPSLSAGAPAAGTHVIQLPDGRFMVLVGGSTATQIYDWKSNSFSAGSTMTVTIGAGAHSFQRSDGKWVVVAGGNSTSLMLYDPTSGANGAFSNLASGLSAAAGAGALTFQRPDGKYIVVHGNTVQTTTLYDAGWNTTGTWTSEDILNTKISTYSAMIWSANPQSANNNARLDAETINIAVKTGDTLTSLGNNPYRTLQDSGDLIRAYGNSQYAKIQVTFTVPVRSYPGGSTAYISQTNIWDGEGGTFLRRSFIQPTVFSMRIQNPLVSYGDPSGQGDPAFGRNFATASAQLEGVGTDNSNRLTLLTLRNQPTATASAGIIIASASANLGGNAGAGAHTIERNNGQFLTILGGGTTTTRTYDSDTNTWSAGPDLPNAAGAGAHSFLLPDGRFFVVLGNTTNKTAIFDPQTSLFLAGPNLFGNVGTGANSFQRPDGYFVILNGGATPATNILDPFTMTVTQGPFTAGATPNVGAGALNIKRSDGRVTIILGNGNAIATGTNVYDPASNSFAAGPALVGGTVNTGGSAIQINTGRILLFKSTATSNWYDPVLNTFAAGPTPTANGAGAFVIPRSDGKIFKANGGNAATTNIIDPQSGVAVTATSAPTLPCNINTGAHTFQRPTGEYVVICGGSTANTLVIDAGWNLGGTYTTEQIQVPNLSSTSSIFWKNIGQGNITVKYRTASSQQALGVASWKDAVTSGSYLSPSSGDTWLQARFDLQGYLQDLPGAKTRVWLASDSGGNMVYYRPIQTPILEYWKVMNIQDPTLLTLTSGGENVFRFSSDGQAYTSDNGAWNSGGADLAERYQSQDSLVAGEVVSLDRFHPQNTKRSTIAYDQNAMGVVSTQPGFVAGAYTENSYPIALVGRVPVKVSTENGEIKAGDYLTSASIPGYAMKATVAGRVIGQAMEDFTPDLVQDCPKFGAGSLTTTRCGTVTVFVNLTSYNGESVDVAMKDAGYALKEEELPVIIGMDFTPGTDARRQQEVLSFLKTQKDNGQSIYTDRIAATQEVISPQIVTDLLVAKKIKAESIEGLEIITNSIERLTDQVGTGSAIQNFSDRLTMLSLTQKDFETQVSSLSAKLDKISSLNLLSFIAQGSTSGELTMVNNFASYGTTTLSEASVMNTITIGTGSTLNLSNNSLYTLGDNLSIQPFRQGGVNFLGGLISFDTDGKATFKEDVAFEKNVGVAGVLSAKTIASTELQLGQGETTVVSDTEVTATAAAGLVTLKKNTDHVKVNNPLVRDNSFIFITPKTKTLQQLFLLDQIESTSFTVGVDGKSTEDIKFNYLIVN